jgi:hypothetical protein
LLIFFLKVDNGLQVLDHYLYQLLLFNMMGLFLL